MPTNTISDFNTRYERHIDLPGFGIKGQNSLLSSTALIIGAGGLGCPVALYLAAAGVGHIILADDDIISLSNLQRQIAYTDADIGKSKVAVLAEHLRQQNPHIQITAHNMRLTKEWIINNARTVDLIIDCTDNFASRYATNAAAVTQGTALLSGSVIYQSGQVALFAGYLPDRPCYQCLYPVMPTSDMAPTCTESAVLGPICGVIGSLMAVQALNYLAHKEDGCAGKLLMYEGQRGETHTVDVKKSGICPVCNNIEIRE